MQKLKDLIAKLTHDDVFRQVALRGAVGLLVKIAAAILSLSMFVVIARVTNAEDYGRFGFVFSLATLLAVVGGFGQMMFSLKQSSIYWNKGDSSRLSGVFLWGLGLTMIGCFSLSLLLYLLGKAVPDLSMAELLPPLILLTFSLGLAEFLTHYLRGYRSIFFSLAPRDLIWRAFAILAFAAAFFAENTLTAWEVTFIVGAVLFVIILTQALLDKTSRSTLLNRLSPIFEIRLWWSSSYKLWLISIVQTIGGPVLAPILLGLIFAPSDTGPLFAALRIALGLELFTMAAGIAIAPSVAQMSSLNNERDLQKILTQSVASVSVPTFLVFALIVWQGENILRFMNPEFASAHSALVVLSFGYLISVCTGPVVQFMQLTGQEGALMKVLVACNLSCLALYYVLISFYGTLGAAIAAMILRVVVHLVLVQYIRKRSGLDPSILSLLGTPQ